MVVLAFRASVMEIRGFCTNELPRALSVEYSSFALANLSMGRRIHAPAHHKSLPPKIIPDRVEPDITHLVVAGDARDSDVLVAIYGVYGTDYLDRTTCPREAGPG